MIPSIKLTNIQYQLKLDISPINLSRSYNSARPNLVNHLYTPQTSRINEDVFASPQLFNASLQFKSSQIQRIDNKISQFSDHILTSRVLRKRTIDLQTSTGRKADFQYKNIFTSDYAIMSAILAGDKSGLIAKIYWYFPELKTKMKTFPREMFLRQLIQLPFNAKNTSIITQPKNILNKLTQTKFKQIRSQYAAIIGKDGERFFNYVLFIKAQNNEFQPQLIHVNQDSFIEKFIENTNRSIMMKKLEFRVQKK
ncbi:hypothetical protein SS50377_20467 [Spironucleus salmonicida]|uniref:Uncharacterized protein n=1 Tax=Spironucleus salmonicida TaxID=348837 RepID=V6LPH2_9EUKA|nr:hypothetical protein SS50377_20467 [Spironucleus salmonicida]|eukprot:EST45616.1 Hypothetical protein SS50377_14472 [Spironucleus salmonicida]